MEDQQAGELWVIVAAAGESRRMGLPDGESKQFLLLGGEPILNHSVRRLLAMPEVTASWSCCTRRTPCASPASSWPSTTPSRC